MCGSRTGRSRSPASERSWWRSRPSESAALTCTTTSTGGSATTWFDEPMVIGHESAGTVVEVGEGVSPERVGELVALEPGVPCRRCPQCLRGRYNLCPDVIFFATPPVDGSISRFVAIDAAFAHPARPG